MGRPTPRDAPATLDMQAIAPDRHQAVSALALFASTFEIEIGRNLHYSLRRCLSARKRPTVARASAPGRADHQREGTTQNG